MKAKGKVREIIKKVGEVQDKVGMARSLHYNDVSMTSFERAQDLLEEAFELCLEIRGMYDLIQED